MDKKLQNKLRKQEFENDNPERNDSDSDDMDEEEKLDLTKRTKEITNQDQIQPQEVYTKSQVANGNQEIIPENKGMDQEDEEIKDEEYDMVNVDLNFYDPSEKQFHAIKILVNGYLDGLSFNSSELSDIIIKQVTVGTMVGIDDQDQQEQENQQNIFAFTTTLPMHVHQEVKVFKEIAQFISEKSLKHNSKHQELISVLQNPQNKIGLLINERILNCSPFVVPTLHQQFLQDLQWLHTEKPEEGVEFKFNYLLVMSKVYKDNTAQQQVQKKKQQNLGDYIYQKFEDFKFLEQSELHFMFEAENTKSGGGVTSHNQDVKDQICYRVVYLLKWENYQNVVPLLPQELIPLYEGQMQEKQI